MSETSEEEVGSARTALHEQRAVPAEEVRHLVECLTLRDIHLVRWSGNVTPGDPVVADVDLETEPALVRILPNDLSLWFEHRVRCRDAEGEVVADIEAAVVANFDVCGDVDLDLPLASCFADTNGAFMAWPYTREAIQTMSVRLGLAPITVGILRRNIGDGRDGDTR
jgi:hypothetical protein